MLNEKIIFMLMLQLSFAGCSGPSAGSGEMLILASLLSNSCTDPLLAVYTQSSISVQNDVSYDSGTSLRKADIYSPPGSGPFPVLLLVHGGGFYQGDKSDLQTQAYYYAQRGFVAAPINYFLAQQDGSDPAYAQSMQDVYCAIRSLRANAISLKIDKTRLALMGDSAGGTLVNMISLGGASAPFNGGCQQNGESVSVQAAIDYYGASDFSAFSASDPRSLTVFGPSPSGATLTDASAVTYVSSTATPFFITHGTADASMPIAQSTGLNQALEAQGADVTYYQVDGAPHGFMGDWNGSYNQVPRCKANSLLSRILSP